MQQRDVPRHSSKEPGRRLLLSGAGPGLLTHGSVKSLPAPSGHVAPSRALLFSGAVSSIGDGFTIVALALMVTTLTRDPRAVAAVFVASRLPWLVGIYVARLVDRCGAPALVLVGADVGRAVVLGVTALVVAVQGASVPLLAGCGAVLGMGTLVHGAARNVLLPKLASGPALARLNGYLSSFEGLGYAAVGPALGGLVFAIGPSVPLAVDAATFLLSAVAVATLRGIRFDPPARSQGPRPAGAVPTVLRHPLLRLLLAQSAVLGLTQAMVLAVTPLFLRDALGVDRRWYGLLLGGAALGGIATGFATPHLWAARKGTFALASGAGLTGGLAYVAMSGQRSAVGALLCLLAYDGTVGVMNTVSPTLRLEWAPVESRAATATLFRQVIVGAYPVGALTSALLARQWGVRTSIEVAGALAVACFGLAAGPLRRTIATLGA